ncbi:DNA/RNA non-specific endonuclease [Eisenibacter elegans]|jgi:endonuclease G|uniref:DNA/RNA non-specific endonuclease n=1 Tax=Eisenibacter elegans TaxID=997 RepID=UPI0004189C85|nr:DNA/RNA non-specific endonuclease [Eisenibacter elegans]
MKYFYPLSLWAIVVLFVLGSCQQQRSDIAPQTPEELWLPGNVSGSTATPTRDNNLALGNPSGANSSHSNYLMTKSQFAMSYNRFRGTPNWVSWHLSAAWLGSTPRQDDFRTDTALPADWYRVRPTDYQGSGFDRGHVCPSADRTGSVADNSATFLMTNMFPQSPNNNRITWEQLESYCRTLVRNGYELYIIAGQRGTGGTGSNGYATTIAGGNVTVPSITWKVIVVLPVGSNDLSRINNNTRVIAVNMPNNQTVNSKHWSAYRCSVRSLEQLTGYNFLSNVPQAIQDVIENRVDNVPIAHEDGLEMFF